MSVGKISKGIALTYEKRINKVTDSKLIGTLTFPKFFTDVGPYVGQFHYESFHLFVFALPETIDDDEGDADDEDEKPTDTDDDVKCRICHVPHVTDVKDQNGTVLDL